VFPTGETLAIKLGRSGGGDSPPRVGPLVLEPAPGEQCFPLPATTPKPVRLLQTSMVLSADLRVGWL
jgi:hypothetical protein